MKGNKENFAQKLPQTSTVAKLADYLPWLQIFPDGTVLTRDIKLMATWRLDLPDTIYASARWAEINRQVASWQQQQTTGVVYVFDMHRNPSRSSLPTPDEAVMGAVAAEIERYREKIFEDPSLNNTTTWYVSIIVPIEIDADGITKKTRTYAETVYRSFETVMLTIDARCHRLLANGDEPDVFGKTPWDPRDSMLSYLATCASTMPKKVRCPRRGLEDISRYLVTEALSNGRPLILGNTYIQPMTINIFPSETLCGRLFQLQMLPFPCRWTTRWMPMSNFDSQSATKKARTAARAASKSLMTLAVEASSGEETGNYEMQALTDVQDIEETLVEETKGECIGDFTSTILVYGSTLDEIDERVQRVREALIRSEYDAIVEYRSACFSAWLGTMPGDTKNNLRRVSVTASNLSEIIPFSSVYHGQPRNDYFERITGVGDSHVLGKTITNETYHLNLNGGGSEDVFHTFVVGATGSGKSILMALLAEGFLRYPGSRVIYFDVDKSFENFCTRAGGVMYTPAEDEALNFMPLSRIVEKPSEAGKWLELAIMEQGVDISPEIAKDIAGICSNWDKASIPTLERFAQRYRGVNPTSPGLAALERILANPDTAKLFGGDSDSFNKDSFARITMIEMRKLMKMGDNALLPTLSFLFDRIDEMFDATLDAGPTLMILDEAWSFLKHPFFRKKISDWLKTLRKKKVGVMFALQNINDLKDSQKDIEEFLSACHTKIYLPNSDLASPDNVTIADIYRGFGLNDDQIYALGHATRKKHYLVVQKEGSTLVDFCIDPWQLERIARSGF